MHLAGCWSLTVLAAALLLADFTTEAAGKADKASSLEDELESSLPQPELTGEQQLKAAAAAAAAASGSGQARREGHQGKQQQVQHHEAAIQEPPHHAKQPKESHSDRPSRQDLHEMFRHLLESMTEAERKSLTLRLGKESVKRTFSQMREEVRTRPGSALAQPARKRVAAPPSEAKAAVLRMRRSLLRSAMESGMPAARKRRRKRDLIDYSPEEYDQLMQMLSRQPVGYVEDAQGDIRPAEGDEDGQVENDDADERKRRGFDYGDNDVEADAAEDAAEERAEPSYYEDNDRARYDVGLGANDVEAAAMAPLPPPVPPPVRQPLTMFLVRMAGEKGLFVPLDQDRAQQMAVELSSEAAIAEVAEAQAEAEAEAEAEDEAERRSELETAGIAELKRFAEKLARRVPPGY